MTHLGQEHSSLLRYLGIILHRKHGHYISVASSFFPEDSFIQMILSLDLSCIKGSHYSGLSNTLKASSGGEDASFIINPVLLILWCG